MDKLIEKGAIVYERDYIYKSKIDDLYYRGILHNINDSVYYNLVGQYYHYVKKNKTRMERYYNKAIRLGDGNAMYNMGLYYKNKNDYDKMMYHFRSAVRKNNDKAMYELGLHYKNNKKYRCMVKYYTKSAELGNVKSMYELASYYKDKEYVVDMEKYLLMAYDITHDPHALYKLGVYYGDVATSSNTSNIIDDIYNDNEEFYKKDAADLGHIDAQYEYGFLCVLHSNLEEAEEYLNMAHSNNHYFAIYTLIDIYEHYEDYEEMERCMLISSDRGFVGAMYSLAVYYKNKKENYDEMKKYLHMAINMNYNDTSYLNYYYMGDYNIDGFLETQKYYQLKSMKELGDYYKNIGDLNGMEKYYLMYIDNNEKKKIDKKVIDSMKEFFENMDDECLFEKNRLETIMKNIDKFDFDTDMKNKIINK